jgi:hypothetical protein
VQAINSEYTERMDDYLGGISEPIHTVEEVVEDVQ